MISDLFALNTKKRSTEPRGRRSTHKDTKPNDGQKSRWWQRVGTYAWTVVAGFGTLLAFETLRPKFEIEGLGEMVPGKPFSQTFEIRNVSIFGMDEVEVFTFINRIQSRGISLRSGVAMGMDKYPDLPSGDAITTRIPTVIAGAEVEFADVGIVLHYSPSYGLWSQSKMFRLTLEKDSQGRMSWRNQPADEPFRNKWENELDRIVKARASRSTSP